jgi:uncharacterized protein with HEPN domain
MHEADRIRLRHMIDAAEAAVRFLNGRSRLDLDRDQLLLFGVVRAIEVVGEAAAKLSEPVRIAASDIPWSAIVSMRNRLIHGYFDIDPDIVWVTATVELPSLLPKLRAMHDKVD